MATNSVTTTKNGYTLTLKATERSYDAVNNSSVVALELSLSANGTYFQQYLCSGALSVGALTVKTYSAYYSLSGFYDSVVLASFEGVFYHNADGTLSLSVKGTFSGPTGGAYTPGSGTVTLTLPCTSLPRASQINSISGTLEAGITVGVKDNLSNPVKNLTLSVGNTVIATRKSFTTGKVVLTAQELLAGYRAAGAVKSTTLTATLETSGVGKSVKTLAVPLAGNLRHRRDGAFERGRLFIWKGGWKSAVILAFVGSWRRGL